ncbi:MAG: RluA family pseudouridine synthase [Ruminococcaceae bacterium]|nr:RluA family pseudouridine synthase [Oscillospiraceae bacterium]
MFFMDISVLFEDAHILVVVKPPMLVCESTAKKDGLADLLLERTGGYIGTVHRLDRGVGGVMVYAKTPAAAAKLSAAVAARELKKEYLTVVRGTPDPEVGEMRDLLFHDRRQNKTFVVERQRAGVKEAFLEYDTVDRLTSARGEECSLVHVLLHTGRTHQIRVQFASRGHTLLGDGKYGARGDNRPIALFAKRLTFLHPVTRKKMEFEAEWDALGEILMQR